jgi:hypothetical protein
VLATVTVLLPLPLESAVVAIDVMLPSVPYSAVVGASVSVRLPPIGPIWSMGLERLTNFQV